MRVRVRVVVVVRVRVRVRVRARVRSGSCATRPPPVDRPRALRNVKAIPPPMTTLSAFSSSTLITPILDETLG